MNRFFALVILLGWTALSAQVQIGKNVQIGAGGGTGGNINPAPQYRLFMQPNTGTDTVAGPAVTGTNAVAPLMQGVINPNLYSTGSGNNGVTNALSSSDCSAGCFFARPQTSTDTENIPSALNGASALHLRGADAEFGANHQFFKNAGNNSANVREIKQSTFLFNDTPANPYIKENGFVNYYTMATPGTYIVGSPHGSHMYDDEMWTYGRSISSLSGANIYAYHVGDAFDAYHYFHYRGGCVQFQDECVKGIDRQLIEAAAPFGTVTSGGHGATTVTLNYTGNAGNQGDGYYLLDTSQVLTSGLLLSTTNVTQPALDTMTTSDTHAVSNAWGTVSASCGAQTRRNAPASATCSLSSITGTFSAAAGATACIADPDGPEQVAVTAVGSGTITALMAFSHPVGTPVYQGGLCGGMAALGYGNTNPASSSQIQAYWVAGSKTTTSFDYLVAFKGGQQGNPLIPIPALEPLSLISLSRVSGVVTATVKMGLGYQYNTLTAPGSSSLVVSGATDFNGTITNPTYNGATGVISWAQSGIDETAGSATLTLTNYNNYVMYAGAETVAPPPVTLQSSGPPLPGNTLQLEANQGNWTAGDSFIQENSIAQGDELTDFVGTGYTFPLGGGNNAHITTLSGKKWSAAVYYDLETSDTASMFTGQGGFLYPRSVMKSGDYLTNLFTFNTAPMNGGYVFSFGCPVQGCNASATTYKLFQNQGNGGASSLYYEPANNRYGVGNALYSQRYLGAQSAIGIGGLAGTPFIAPGTAAWGGYFTPVGDPASVVDTLVLGTGKVGDSTGTFGANALIAPNVTVGLNAPANFSIGIGGAVGSTTYSYACTAVNAAGVETNAGTGTTTIGNATLSATNYTSPNCFGVPGASYLNIYRTAGGATQGKINSSPIPNGNGNNLVGNFIDTGLVGDGTSPPTANLTGKLIVRGASDGCATFTSNVLGSIGIPCGSGGGISGLTPGVIPKAASSTTVANSLLDDGVTTANTLTYGGTGGIAAKSFTSTDTSHNTSVTGKQAAGGSDVLPTQATGNSYLAYIGATGWNEADGTGSFSPLTRTVDFAAGAGMSVAVSGKTVTYTATGIANVTTTVGTTAIAANTCSAAVTVTMTGVATTSVFSFTPNADVSGVTGWGTTGGLTIVPWPTANTLNYKVCNQTATSITPSASVTFNVGAR